MLRSLAWKLAALAAVVAIGVLVMLQAQRAMSQAALNRSANAGTTADSTKSESAKPSAEAANSAPKPSGANGAAPNGDPFAEADDSKSAVADAAKSAPDPAKAPPGPPTGPTVVQTPTPPPAPTLPPATPTTIAKTDPNAAAKLEPGPAAATGPAQPAVHGDAAAAAGPQLIPPGGPVNPAPAIAPPALSLAVNEKKTNTTTPAAAPKGQSEPSLFPDSDAAAAAAPPKTAASPPGPSASADSMKGGAPQPIGAVLASAGPDATAQTPAKDSSKSGGHPGLLPADAGNELPLPKSADASTSSGTAPAASRSGSAGGSTAAGDSADGRSDSGSEFQGDGTVNETAPLGPQRPQLSIEKVAPQNALIGQPLVYSIVVKNIGSNEAHDVVVDDRIPKGTRLSGTIPRAELSGKKLTWRIGNLGPGEQRKISIRVIPLEAGEIGSVASVNFVAEAAAETVVTAPRLEFELLAPPTARLGEMVPFHFKVKNIGTGEARGVVIRDLIPDGLSHAAGSDLEYEVGRLPAGKTKDLTLSLKTTKVGTTVNKAVVTGEGGLSTNAQVTIEISGSKVNVSRTGPPRRYLGRPAVYVNTLVNESKYAVEGVLVVESVPTGMEFVGATHNGQYNDGTRTISWRVDRMAPGETCIVKSKLVPKTPGKQASTVRVSIPNGEPVEASTETVAEGFAAFGLEVASVEGPVELGEKITFRVSARNKGTVPATNVRIVVDVPEELAIVSLRGPGRHEQEKNQVRFGPLPALEGRTAATCEIVLEARKRGDSRIRVTVHADQVDRPLSREESVLILSESTEPAAHGS